MKKTLFFITTALICTQIFSQTSFVSSNIDKTSGIVPFDPALLVNINGKEYLRTVSNSKAPPETLASVWTDIKVPVTATSAAGSNPPRFSSFLNSGGNFIGSALSFNGVDQFDSIPANRKLDFIYSDFTISFWIQPEATKSASGIANIIYKKGGWNISIQNKKIRVSLEGAGVLYSTGELLMGERNFVVLGVNNNHRSCTAMLYLNNKLSSKQFYDYPMTDIIAPVLIGKPEHCGYGDYYKGVLDELNIWNKYLSPQERDSLWNNSKGTETIIATQSHVAGFSFEDNNPIMLLGNDAVNNINAFTRDNNTAPQSVKGLISENIISHGVFTYYFDKDASQELFFSAELPHSWQEQTESKWQVHYIRPTHDTGTVVWGLEYSWTNTDEQFSNTKTIYVYDTAVSKNDINTVSSFNLPDVDGKKINSEMVCRIFRDSGNPKDTYNHEVGLLEIDLHVKSNVNVNNSIAQKVNY